MSISVSSGGVGKPPSTPLLQPRHESPVAELLPALLRLVDGHDRPTTRRGAGGMEDLTVGQLVVARMDRGERRLVVLLRTAGEVGERSRTP